MAIDPSISLGFRAPVIPPSQILNPVEQFGQILSLRNLMTQGQLGQLGLQTHQLELQKLRDEMKERDDLTAVLAQARGSGPATPALITPSIPPVQPTAIGGTVPQIAPATIAPFQPAPVPTPAPDGATTIAPNFGLSAAPAGPIGNLMAGGPPPASAAAIPAMGDQGGPKIGGLSYGDFLARFPRLGPGLLKTHLELEKAQSEADVKHNDVQKQRWEAMAGAAQAVTAAKNPAAEYVSQLTGLYNGGYINTQELAALRDHGYDPTTMEGWKNRAISQTDFHTIQKTDLETQAKERTNFALAMRGINDQAGYDKIFPRLSPALQAEVGSNFSPQLKAVTSTWDVSGADLPKTQAAQLQFDSVKLANAMKDGPKATAEAFASLSPDSQKQLAGVKTWQEAIQRGLTPEQTTTAAQAAIGKTEPKPQAVIDQEIAVERAKEGAKADPFGLFAGTTGATTTGAPAAGVTPTPLAQAIATFEGFDKAGSVAQRNNNPGNLRAGPGQTGTDKNGYAIFPDLNTGWSALHDLIQKRSGDNLTLQEFFGGKKGVYPGYAPAADKNDPANYAATVAKTLGVDPNAKLADIPGSLPAAAKPGARITPDMQGQAVIDALPGPVAQMVKGYAEGRLTFPTGRALMSPFMQQMLGLVGQYDPSFDVNNPGKRAATAKAFAVGKEGQQINALNTAIGHVDDLSKSADKLDNTWSPAYNTIANLISKQMGRPAVNNFDTTKKAVVDELTRVWRGTGGSEADIKSWSQSLDAANSPEQLHGAIATIGRLLESKLGALEDQYREGMGTISQGRHMITPDARKTLDRLEQKAGNTPSTAKAGPAVGSVEDGYRFKGGDPKKPENWEKQ